MTPSEGAAGGSPTVSAGKSGTGLAPNIAALLCYLLMPVTCGAPVAGIVFLVIEKGNDDVRFHAWQSIVLGVTLWIGNLVLNGLWAIVPFVGILFRLCSLALALGGLAAWIVCMIKAYQNERWRIPYLGDIAAKQAKL